MKLRLIGGLAAVAVALLIPLAASADSHERPSLASVWIFAPKQGMTAEFEKALREHAAMREKGEDSRGWTTYSVAMGDHMGIYQVRYCCFDWADEDAYTAENADKGFGAHFQETVGRYIDHMHHYIETMDWENSSYPEDIGEHQYYGVTSWVWKEGASPEVDEVRRQFSQMALEEGWGDDNHWLWHSRVGGKPMLMIVSPFADYADMAPPEQSFFEFLDENSEMDADEVSAMFQTFGSGFASSDYTVWQSRPDLSVSTGD